MGKGELVKNTFNYVVFFSEGFSLPLSALDSLHNFIVALPVPSI